MSRDFKSELDKIDEFIDKLGTIAGADGKITKDEQALLDEVMSDLSDYRLLVMDALEDGEVDSDEKQQMESSLNKIVDNAGRIALSDGNLSNDEEDLINSLINFAEED